MRVVSIFGGTGFIGTELIHELEKKNSSSKKTSLLSLIEANTLYFRTLVSCLVRCNESYPTSILKRLVALRNT